MNLLKGFLLPVVFILAIVLIGCPEDPVENEESRTPLEGVRDGTAIGLGNGFARDMDGAWHTYEGLAHDEPGDYIEVTVTVLYGFITNVIIVGKDETPAWGGVVMNNAPEIVIARNKFDLVMADITDAIAAATATVNGVNEAGNAALDTLRDNGGDT